MRTHQVLYGPAAIITTLLVSLACTATGTDEPTSPMPPATRTATASTTPIASLEQMPTATPRPTRTPWPTRTPSPTRTPQPTATPTITPAQAPPGLVYVASGSLWLVQPGGEPRLLLDQAVPPHCSRHCLALSPDGSRALIGTDVPGEKDLWLIELSTGERRNLTAGSGRANLYPQWWPARPETVILGSWDPDAVEDAVMSTGSLTIVNTDGSGYRVLEEAWFSNSPPAPSPDGQTIAYTRLAEPWLYRLDSGPTPFRMEDYGLQLTAEGRTASPSWSPDGRLLAWWIMDWDQDQTWVDKIVVFDLEQRTHQVLHQGAPVGRGGWPVVPAWSPDGSWLAIVAETHSEAGVWVFDVRGEQQGKAIYLGGYPPIPTPVWSPDGRRLAYLDEQAPQAGVWLADVDTQESYPVALPADAVPIAWLDVV